MEDRVHCPECDADDLRVIVHTIDRVSGHPMPGALQIILAGLNLILGVYLAVLPVRSIAEPGWWAVVLFGAGLIFSAVHTGWLLLFGQPVHVYEFCCRECLHTWDEREDLIAEAGRIHTRLA